MDEEDLRFYLTKNVSKREISNLDTWIKADGCSLSEGIFLIEGKQPSNTLETIRGTKEYQKEWQNYCLAERSIKSAKLQAKKTDHGYWVSINDLLTWALDKKIGNLKIIDLILEERHLNSVDRPYEPTSSQKDVKNHRDICPDINVPQTSIHETSNQSILVLNEKAKKLLVCIINARTQAITLALDAQFSTIEDKEKNFHLIGKIGSLPESYFLKYNKGPNPPSVITEHRCRAIGSFLRIFEPDIKIFELNNQPLMNDIGWRSDKRVSNKTFGYWMNREKIFDRCPKK